MKPENEINQILPGLGIEPDHARRIAADIEAADRCWEAQTEPPLPAELLSRIEGDMARSLTRRRIGRIRFFRMVAAAACLIVVLGAALFQMNLAGRPAKSLPAPGPITEQKTQVVVDDNVFYELKYWQENRQNFYHNTARPVIEQETTPATPKDPEAKKDKSVGVPSGNPIA